MVDVTEYIKQDFPDPEGSGGTEGTAAPVELTKEDQDRLFFDFEKIPELTAKFKGPGQTFTYKGTPIETWSFTDTNDLSWLIPQWEAMNAPQLPFKGFQEEVPGEHIYFIKYNGQTDQGDGHFKYNFSIFRKKA